MTKQSPALSYKSKIKTLGYEDAPIQPVQGNRTRKAEASRETRKRKKIYISLLESRLKHKQDEIIRLNRELDEFRKHKVVKDGSFHTNLKERADLFQKIAQSIASQNQVDTKLYLDMLRMKLGVGGAQRQSMLSVLLKQFTEMIMPMHLRCLLEVCEQKKQFYELFSDSPDYKLHMNFGFLNLDQKRDLSAIRPLLYSCKESYKNLIRQTVFLQRMVRDQNRVTQEVLDGLQKAFSPCFVAQFLLKLDQKRTGNSSMASVFPVNYFQAFQQSTHQKQQQKRLNDIYQFSVSGNQVVQLAFPNVQDDFDYLL